MFAVGLVLEPLTYSQAKQLGSEVLGHCFSEKKHIHDGLTSVTVELPDDEQILIARMAEDVAEHCRLRHVRIPSVTITKRDSSESGAETKSKKVGPQQPTLRATFQCLIDPAEKTHRDFLALNFAKSFLYTFESEQENLFTGVHTDPEDGEGDDDKDQGSLKLDGVTAPPPDPAAGDILDDEKPKRSAKASRKPKLVTDKDGKK